MASTEGSSTVTIDQTYFETLLRRAECHTSGSDLSTPLDPPTVSIPKADHDNLLRLVNEYRALKEALSQGGIAPETLEVLIHGSDRQLSARYHDILNRSRDAQTLPIPPHKSTGLRSVTSIAAEPARSKSGSVALFNKWKIDRCAQDDPLSYASDCEKDDAPAPAIFNMPSYANSEQRSIVLNNLPDHVTLKNLVDVVRGGALLDIYLRPHERCAYIAFVEGAAAQAFIDYAKHGGIYIHNKRAEVAWNDRHFTLPGHVGHKIQHGATRNLVVHNVNPNVTAERIRKDLDHIHNLAVVGISMVNGSAYISLNSVHNALYARTCMISRTTYKGSKIEWYPDECARPLPGPRAPAVRKASPAKKKKDGRQMFNRFEMLNMDGTECDSSSE